MFLLTKWSNNILQRNITCKHPHINSFFTCTQNDDIYKCLLAFLLGNVHCQLKNRSGKHIHITFNAQHCFWFFLSLTKTFCEGTFNLRPFSLNTIFSRCYFYSSHFLRFLQVLTICKKSMSKQRSMNNAISAQLKLKSKK